MSDISDGFNAAKGLVDSLKETKTGQSVDELISTVPRTINVLLTPLRKWIVNKEVNFEETEKLIRDKLKDVPVEKLQEPEAYIAVPTLQSLSYSMDSNQLRDMYANLLARAMHKDYSDKVHPGLVDVIKQLSPLDAKMLEQISKENILPMLTVNRRVKNTINDTVLIRYFNSLSIGNIELAKLVDVSISNLMRLGLVYAGTDYHLTDDQYYKPLTECPIIKSLEIGFDSDPNFELNIARGVMYRTPFGETFTDICMNNLPSPQESSPSPQAI